MKPKRRLNQAEKSEATRQALFDAATKVVGRDGYSGASISKITSLANVAQGTFYYYFESQQDLFDSLLPALGNRLLKEIREATTGCRVGLKREQIGFRTFFNFMLKTPEFYRVLSEAEIFAPKAYRTHMNNVSGRYLRALTRSWEANELHGFQRSELDAIAFILSGAMFYLTVHVKSNSKKLNTVPEELVQTYIKFVAQGMGIHDWEAQIARPDPTTDMHTAKTALTLSQGTEIANDRARETAPNYATTAVPAADQTIEIDLGRADELFPPSQNVADRILAIFIKCKDAILGGQIVAKRYCLTRFSYETFEIPGPEVALVARVHKAIHTSDMAVITVTIMKADREHFPVIFANGTFADSPKRSHTETSL